MRKKSQAYVKRVSGREIVMRLTIDIYGWTGQSDDSTRLHRPRARKNYFRQSFIGRLDFESIKYGVVRGASNVPTYLHSSILNKVISPNLPNPIIQSVTRSALPIRMTLLLCAPV
jgi:hypothetical protein